MLPYLIQTLVQEPPVDADVSVTWPALWGGIAAICTVASLVLGALAVYVKWVVRSETASVKKTAERTLSEVSTGNGHKLGQLAENNSDALGEILKIGQDNRTLIVDVSRRLDEHVIRGHGQ